MTAFRLNDLGPYRIEKTEDYRETVDRSFAEIIRVKGSRSRPPAFETPSHIYKFSDSELALYLKDHKNTWRDLSRILGRKINISDEEIILVFPVFRFHEISGLIQLVRKRGRVEGSMTPEEKSKAMHNLGMKSSNKINQNVSKSSETSSHGPITLDAFGGA
ncbi:hypothetical protein Thermo_00102 [Thermoplasmatales archaeon]|nr:hypothetical protein Thermo_00102 [Thermoplasmatales archaeon]